MVAASNTSKSLKPLMKFLLEECSHIDVNLANKVNYIAHQINLYNGLILVYFSS